jgi:glycosyltransferase involved in cell wall biosynthesis
MLAEVRPHLGLMNGSHFATTYVHPWHLEWSRRTRSIDVRRARARGVVRLVAARRPAILHAASGLQRGYADLIAAAALARLGQPVLLAEATWEPGSRALSRLLGAASPVGYDAAPARGQRLGRTTIHLLDRSNVHYGVLSSDEVPAFAETWGVDVTRVHYTPFCATWSELPYAPGGAGVIASGNSLRDYRGLLEASFLIKAEVRLATALPLPPLRAANLQAGFLSGEEHVRQVREAAVVVVPLLHGTVRSAGQQTYLNAMGCGKAVVVTEAPGVHDYIRHGETGLIVRNEATALAEAINHLLADPEYARQLGDAAREDVRARFSARSYVDRLLELADVVLR